MIEIAPNIVVDPATRFSKPIIQGTRVTVEEVLRYLAGGMDAVEIEQEYGVPKQGVRAAIDYAASFLKGETISTPKQE